MNERYIQNARDIIQMLTAHPEFVPVMVSFCSVTGTIEEVRAAECGTTYCLAGMQARLDNYPSEFVESLEIFNYRAYSRWKCGFNVDTNEWIFIYGGHWPDTRESAIARCQYIVANGAPPPQENWGDYI